MKLSLKGLKLLNIKIKNNLLQNNVDIFPKPKANFLVFVARVFQYRFKGVSKES